MKQGDDVFERGHHVFTVCGTAWMTSERLVKNSAIISFFMIIVLIGGSVVLKY